MAQSTRSTTSPGLFGMNMDRVCKPALEQWNARAPGLFEEVTDAVHGPEEIEHPRRFREQRVREEAWGTRMRAPRHQNRSADMQTGARSGCGATWKSVGAVEATSHD